MVKIVGVEKNSRAERAGIAVGDTLVNISGNEITDVLDYRFYLAERDITLSLLREGEEYSIRIKKSEYDDIGLEFETPLMDKKHSCKNGCIFCFIDQNPKGLRESLYFKDDDSRLSFIHGNYVTLTNMSDSDVARIIKMRMSPINISNHTTNPELRVKMMKNKRSGEVLKYLGDFKEAGLHMCGQIVLCRGVNDGDELRRTLSDLIEYYPALTSVSIGPAGLTKHREGLYPLTDFSPKEAAEVIDLVEGMGELCLDRFGTRLFFAADEFYLKASRPIPETEYYEDYPQIENGVGLIRSFVDEYLSAYDELEYMIPEGFTERTVSVVTGAASYPMMTLLASRLMSRCPGLTVNVFRIVNRFFGESITVSGLLTGKDIAEQLEGVELGDELLIPSSALRAGEDVFLCGMTPEELADRLNVSVSAVGSDGYSFVETILGLES